MRPESQGIDPIAVRQLAPAVPSAVQRETPDTVTQVEPVAHTPETPAPQGDPTAMDD